ncbi:multidrug ABC transporter permease [Streptomyces inusitatus]|uniref:Multidrug ABC transporter permease n=1 Tax=Streptomyces inusitatus TaxID=68221 RepID=A0A918Q627_9ACTN|nr:ABC transporter permease [Streptomyces inusitatus]GGZ35116.1 multidrug ABC transporter permease [Streptomyces inusitatus]
MSEATVSAPRARVPVGVPPRAGLRTVYWTLLRWTAAQIGTALPLVLIVQALLAAAVIVGFGFLVPGIDAPAAEFLSSGAPTVLLMAVGLVLVPHGVAQSRANGTFTYLRALPVPRPLLLLADLTVWLVVALPGIPVAVFVAEWRYGLDFALDWPPLVTAALLSAATAVSVGYAIAVLLPPLVAQLASQVLVFFVMLFSPITFPASRLPEWFQTVHGLLPFQPAGDLIRAGLLSDGSGSGSGGRDLLVLLVWCALGIAVSVRALVRRG